MRQNNRNAGPGYTRDTRHALVFAAPKSPGFFSLEGPRGIANAGWRGAKPCDGRGIRSRLPRSLALRQAQAFQAANLLQIRNGQRSEPIGERKTVGSACIICDTIV
jgi:hypothetical protein